MPPSLRIVRVMCSSRVDPLHIINALLAGADGVLVAGCHPGDCHYSRGNYYTRRRFAMLKTLLENIGFEAGRVRLSWISASEGPRFQQVVKEFTEEIKKLGRNRAGEKVFI
jgi:F420-non-reducing hydrogenase iron-sulfur subunit